MTKLRGDHYSTGYTRGVQWAEADIRDHIPPHSEIALLRDETKTDQRWCRAFYLGALRGYREIVRTKNARGEWGT